MCTNLNVKLHGYFVFFLYAHHNMFYISSTRSQLCASLVVIVNAGQIEWVAHLKNLECPLVMKDRRLHSGRRKLRLRTQTHIHNPQQPECNHHDSCSWHDKYHIISHFVSHVSTEPYMNPNDRCIIVSYYAYLYRVQINHMMPNTEPNLVHDTISYIGTHWIAWKMSVTHIRNIWTKELAPIFSHKTLYGILASVCLHMNLNYSLASHRRRRRRLML